MEQELHQVVRDQQHQAQSVEAKHDRTDISEDKSAGNKGKRPAVCALPKGGDNT